MPANAVGCSVYAHKKRGPRPQDEEGGDPRILPSEKARPAYPAMVASATCATADVGLDPTRPRV